MPATSATTRERILAAAVGLTASQGWSKVTMSRLADEVGVSRQTVYNEIGTKAELAESMIEQELTEFLALVEVSFDEHPKDLVRAIGAAALAVLERAADNTLLRAIASATHGADTELLPLLTTHSASLLESASDVIGSRLLTYDEVPDDHVGVMVDAVVRLVISHVMRPGDTPAKVAADLAWICQHFVRR